MNWKAGIDNSSFDSDRLPKLNGFTDKPPFKLTGYVNVTPDAVEIKIKVSVTSPPSDGYNGGPVTYTAALVDANQSSKVLAHLDVILY